MRSHLIAVAAVACVTSVFACDDAPGVGSESSDITEWASAKDVDSAYTTKYVIADICETIYGPSQQASACETDHTFRLVERKHSTKYGYLESIEEGFEAPIEVGQTLSVTAPNDAEFTVTLLRQLDDAFHLRWTVRDVQQEGVIAPPANVEEHILNVADELGEYVDFDDSDDARPTTWEALPAAVQLECESQMLARAEMNSEGDQCFGSAFIGEVGEILLDGNVVGYICGVDDALENCSLWDGSGVWYFLDTSPWIVTETEWSG